MEEYTGPQVTHTHSGETAGFVCRSDPPHKRQHLHPRVIFVRKSPVRKILSFFNPAQVLHLPAAPPSPLASPLSPVLSAALWVLSLGEKGRFGSCEAVQTSRWEEKLCLQTNPLSDGLMGHLTPQVFTRVFLRDQTPQQAAQRACRRRKVREEETHLQLRQRHLNLKETEETFHIILTCSDDSCV